MQKVALIDYEAGNLHSVHRALLEGAERAGAPSAVAVTSDPDIVRQADRIVLPGQGAFGACIGALSMRDGLREAVEEAVRGRGAPFLGICVGMQMLMAIGLEHGARPGLGWIEGVCAPLETEERLPHMGWNAVTPLRAHPMLDGLAPARHMVFMHSYVVVPEAEADVAAVTEHGLRFVSAIARANMVGVQFHPEKSQAAGLDLLGRFLRWRP